MQLKVRIRTFYIVNVILLFPVFGCRAVLDGAMEGLSAGLQGYTEGTPTAYGVAYAKLVLFGGENNKQYLGCLSCSKYELDALTNEYGTYGNQYAATSIWNVYGTYGSRYSQYSWRNPYASNPPVIVDQAGNFYGYFTVNKYFPNRTLINWIVELLNSDLD